MNNIPCFTPLNLSALVVFLFGGLPIIWCGWLQPLRQPKYSITLLPFCCYCAHPTDYLPHRPVSFQFCNVCSTSEFFPTSSPQSPVQRSLLLSVSLSVLWDSYIHLNFLQQILYSTYCWYGCHFCLLNSHQKQGKTKHRSMYLSVQIPTCYLPVSFTFTALCLRQWLSVKAGLLASMIYFSNHV